MSSLSPPSECVDPPAKMGDESTKIYIPDSSTPAIHTDSTSVTRSDEFPKDVAPSENHNVKRVRSDNQVQKRQAKKQWKSKLRALEAGQGTRSEYKSVFGQDCLCSMELIHDEKLQLPKERLKGRDIHTLLLWVMAKAVQARWLFVKNGPVLEKIVTVVIDGLSEKLVAEHGDLLPALKSIKIANAPNPIPLHVPCSIYNSTTALQHFLNCMVEKIAGIERPKKAPRVENPALVASAATAKMGTYPLETFIATPAQLRDNGFPLEKVGKYVDFLETLPQNDISIPLAQIPQASSTDIANGAEVSVSTEKEEEEKKVDAGSSSSPDPASVSIPLHPSIDYSIWRALDCEFVESAKGKILARMTLLDGFGTILTDILVIPSSPVIDYLTRFSGMTEEILEKATITFEEAQRIFLSFVRSENILVGHSLENDLKVLQIIHRNILDSCILFPHPRGSFQRSSLKYLAQVHLDTVIQNDDSGHDSVEDAAVAMQLVKDKVIRGPSYGHPSTHTESFLSILGKLKCRVHFFSQSHILRKFNSPYTDSIATLSDAESVSRAAKFLRPSAPSMARPSLAASKEKTRAKEKSSEKEKEGSDSDSSDSDDSSDSNSDSDSDSDSDDDESSKPPNQGTEMVLLYLNEVTRWMDYEDIPVETTEDVVTEQKERDVASSGLPPFINFNAFKTSFPPLNTEQDITPVDTSRDPRPQLIAINDMVQTLLDASPRNTMFVIMSGQSSVRVARQHAVNVQRLKTLNDYYPSDKVREVLQREEAAFQAEMQQNQNGVVFLGVKE